MNEPRSVLVTGGNRGIGRAIAESFLAYGDRVAVTTRSGGAPTDALELKADVTDAAAMDDAIAAAEEANGPLDVVVANAGITRDTLLLRMADEDWDDVLATNLTSVFQLTRRVAKGMMRRRHGRIILVSSVVALLGSPGQANYAAAKAGLIGLSRSLARELGPRGVTVNVVAPGYVDTDMTAVLTDEQKDAIRSQVPLGRTAAPEEVAGAVMWLADAGYVTGAVIPVDGGLGMGH